MVFVRILNRTGAMLAGTGIFLMMVIGATDVLGLYIFNRPLPGAFEFTEALMVASVFMALAMAQQRRQHVRVEVFIDRMPRRLRLGVEAAITLVTTLVFSLLCWISWSVALQSISIGEFSSGLIKFPVWPARTALAIGVTLMVLQCLVELATNLGLIKRAEDDEWTR